MTSTNFRNISAKTQEAYRQLHHGLRGVAKAKGTTYADIKTGTQQYLQQVYDPHNDQLNEPLHAAFKNGEISKDVFHVKARLELQELLATGEKQQSNFRRANWTSAKKAFADKTQGLRRAFAAARPPLQPPMACIRHNGIPCFDPQSIDKAYDEQVDDMFEGEEGGYRRIVARAAVFIEKYADVIHSGEQYPIKPINASAVHSIITSAGSVAASFDHIYHQELKLLQLAHTN